MVGVQRKDVNKKMRQSDETKQRVCVVVVVKRILEQQQESEQHDARYR